MAGDATPAPVRLRAATGTAGGATASTDDATLPPPAAVDVDWRGPVKRSVTIAGHETSISLEPVFWDALRAAAQDAALPLNALIARIDAARIEAADPPNLASAIRVWLMAQALRTTR